MNADELREALLSSPKNGFVGLSQEERAEMEAYCKRYAAFMNACKTEREATAWTAAAAEARGFKPLTAGMAVQPGDAMPVRYARPGIPISSQLDISLASALIAVTSGPIVRPPR